MLKKSDAVYYGFLLVCFAIGISYRVAKNVRCSERWRYQHTAADTLATVRSGCAIPEGAK